MTGPPLAAPSHRTINGALDAAAASDAGVTFVELDERETFVPFAAVRARAGRTAGALVRAGVAPGDRVALVFPTSPDFLEAFFGVLLAGAVPVPLYPPVRLGRLAEYHAATARMIRLSGARLVLADSRIRKLLGRSVERSRPRLGCATLSEIGRGAVEDASVEVDPGDLALIQYSSGTTTDPKPVALSHSAVMFQLEALKALLSPGDGSPQLGVSWLPLYHDMGLIGCLLVSVYYPGRLVLIPPESFLARPALWLRAISRHRATISVSPPFGFALSTRRVRESEIRSLNLSSWRVALCGAEPIPPSVLDAFLSRFSEQGLQASALRPVYGLAEAALAVTFSTAGRPHRTLGVDAERLSSHGEAVPGRRSIVSVGTPVPGFEVDVRGRDGARLPERRVGRIFARGPSLMASYLGMPEATAATLRDGWLDTGDLGFVDDGELFVSGRAKDLVIIRGANHAPQEFEECLETVPGLRPGGAVALGLVPDGEDGERLVVLAERRRGRPPDGEPGDAETIDLIRASILERTGIAAHAVLLLEPGTLPRTSSGKLRRSEALKRYLAGQLGPPHAAGPVRLSAELLLSSLAFAKARLQRGS